MKRAFLYSRKLPFATLAVALTAAALVSAVVVKAQEQQREPFRVEVEAVNVLLTVHDEKDGKFVTDLQPTDFRVTEDGVLQQITNFTKQTGLPLTIALAVDTSSSVKLKLEFEKDAALDFLYSVMRPTDRALLLEFDSGVTLLHDFTSDPNDLVNEIKNLRAGGGTSLYDAIYLVCEQKLLDDNSGRKILVVLSDGADVTSKHSFAEALDMAFRSEITIFAISTTRFGADIDHEGDNALKQLVEDTGGRAYFPFSTKELGKAFEAINEELRSQYNLAYVSSNKVRDGKFRAIKVELMRPDIKIRHRKGYYARPAAGAPSGD